MNASSLPALARQASFVVLLGLLVALPAASQDEYRPLAGSYLVGGEPSVDPEPGAPTDTHLQVFLTGSAARDLYRALKTKAVPDECVGPNAHSKFDRGIACTMQADGKEFECSFAVDLRTQKLQANHAC
jgi:hypothetical protein